MKKIIKKISFFILLLIANNSFAQSNEIVSGVYIQEVNATQLKKINCSVPMQIVNNPDGSVSYYCGGTYTLVSVTTPPIDNDPPIQNGGCGVGNKCGPKNERTNSVGGKYWECVNSNNYVCATRKVEPDSTVIIILKDSL